MENTMTIEFLIEGSLPPGLAEKASREDPLLLKEMFDWIEQEHERLWDEMEQKEEELERIRADREVLVRSLEIVSESKGSSTEETCRIDDQQAQDGQIDPKALASRLCKSLRWVYDHGAELGGVKIGRTWIFTEEGVRDAYTRQREKTLERSSQVSRKNLQSRFSDQKRGRKLGARKAGGTGEGSRDADANRHGLARLLQ